MSFTKLHKFRGIILENNNKTRTENIFFLWKWISPNNFVKIDWQLVKNMADDIIDLPFRAEYAKSNRAACKACKNKIDKSELRLAVMVQVRKEFYINSVYFMPVLYWQMKYNNCFLKLHLVSSFRW